MESFVKTIHHRMGKVEQREYFAEKMQENQKIRDGWFVLKAKSFKDPRADGLERMPAVNIDGLKFVPGTEFQCHPDHAKKVIDLDQVEVIQKPKTTRKKASVEAAEA